MVNAYRVRFKFDLRRPPDFPYHGEMLVYADNPIQAAQIVVVFHDSEVTVRPEDVTEIAKVSL